MLGAQKEGLIKSTQEQQEENVWSFDYNFTIEQNEIRHRKIVKLEKADDFTPNLKIKDTYSKKNGHEVVKITILHTEDRLVNITDTFHFIQESDSKKHNKHFIHQGNKQFKAKDVRNGVKNITKLFQKWLKQKTSPQLKLTSQLDAILQQSGAHNNNMIIMIAKNVQLRKAFLQFSQNEAAVCINQSKIIDKTSHLQALKKYRMVCCNSEEVDKQEQMFLKKILEEDYDYQPSEEEKYKAKKKNDDRPGKNQKSDHTILFMI